MLRGILLCLCVSIGLMQPAFAQGVKVGEAEYFPAPKGSEKLPPDAPHRTAALMAQAAPTNQWYSTLIFNAKPEAIYAQPLTVKAVAPAFEVALPSKKVVPTFRRDVEIHYPHEEPLVFRPAAFAPDSSKLAKFSDWSIDVSMSAGADNMIATVSHGSPYVFFQLSRGDIQVVLPSGAIRVAGVGLPNQLVVDHKGKRYVVFASTGTSWEAGTAGAWVGKLPQGKGYFTAAALPDDKAATLELFARHAYAFVQDTRVSWQYDQANSTVETLFSATTKAMEGSNTSTIMGLYPHHWHQNPLVADRLGAAYDTVRGQLKTLVGNEFKTRRQYLGWVPFWPAVGAVQGAPDLKDVMAIDVRNAGRMMREGGDFPYWRGKGIMRVINLMNIAEQQGDAAARDRLLTLAKNEVEEWFSGKDRKTYFQYDAKLGTMLSHPEQFFVIEQMNDHYFHYSYWIRAAAEIALRAPDWAAKSKWGGMVDLLVKDIANTTRGEKTFPYLRHFDAYEGHSWANGNGLGSAGNNQESSSEAAYAWAAIILWAEVTGDKALRDVGIYKLTTEVAAIDYYWFDVHQQVFAPEYKNVDTAILFGGKYEHNTWWTDEPRQITGINMLPITSVSTYLGRHPAYVRKNMDSLKVEMETYAKFGKLPPNPPPKDVWQDILSKYFALAEPQQALAGWNRWGSVEAGDSRTHTLHWLLSMNTMGLPDFSITANTPLYAVFKRPDGARTHLAYNATSAPIEVKFSDGKSLRVMPRSLGVLK